MSDDLNYGLGLPWRTSQSPTSGFQRTLLDLPPLLPQEEPVRSEHCHHQEKNHPHFCKKPPDRERNFSLARSEFAENAKELELIAEQVQSVKYLLTFQLLTIWLLTFQLLTGLQFVDKRSTLCCETPITQINSYSQFNPNTWIRQPTSPPQNHWRVENSIQRWKFQPLVLITDLLIA